jgi:hypothetical protein
MVHEDLYLYTDPWLRDLTKMCDACLGPRESRDYVPTSELHDKE